MRLILLLYFSFAVSSWSQTDSNTINYNIGLMSNLVSTTGVSGNLILNTHYGFQLEYFSYDEFEILVSHPDTPIESYSATEALFGYYLGNSKASYGIFSGLSRVNGVVGGAYIRTETDICTLFCGGDNSARYFQEINLNEYAIPLKFVFTAHGKYTGFSVSENVIFSKKSKLYNFLISFEFGKM